MSSVTQLRHLGVILDSSLSDPHRNLFSLALKCLKQVLTTLHPNYHHSIQSAFIFHPGHCASLLSGLTTAILLLF